MFRVAQYRVTESALLKTRAIRSSLTTLMPANGSQEVDHTVRIPASKAMCGGKLHLAITYASNPKCGIRLLKTTV